LHSCVAEIGVGLRVAAQAGKHTADNKAITHTVERRTTVTWESILLETACVLGALAVKREDHRQGCHNRGASA